MKEHFSTDVSFEVSGASGKRIVVVGLQITNLYEGTNLIYIMSWFSPVVYLYGSASGTGRLILTDTRRTFSLPTNLEHPWFVLTTNNNLLIEPESGKTISGFVEYYEV